LSLNFTSKRHLLLSSTCSQTDGCSLIVLRRVMSGVLICSLGRCCGLCIETSRGKSLGVCRIISLNFRILALFFLRKRKQAVCYRGCLGAGRECVISAHISLSLIGPSTWRPSGELHDAVADRFVLRFLRNNCGWRRYMLVEGCLLQNACKFSTCVVDDLYTFYAELVEMSICRGDEARKSGGFGFGWLNGRTSRLVR